MKTKPMPFGLYDVICYDFVPTRHRDRCDMPRHWKEARGYQSGRHAPSDYRRSRVRMARLKENHHLRNSVANGTLETYEPLRVAKRDADWLYF